MKYLVELPVDGPDGRAQVVGVEIEQTVEGLVKVSRPGQVVARAARSLGEMLAAIHPVADSFVGGFADMHNVPDEIGLEFGLSLSADANLVVATSDDGHLLAASGPSGNGLSVWNTADASTPKLASSLVTPFDLAGVTFSDDDKMMADWTQQTVQLWDTQDPGVPALVGSFSPAPRVGSTTTDERVIAAGFTQGGSKLVVSTESDGPSLVYILDTNPRQAADQLCSVTSSPITPAQWAQDAPGIPYQNPCSR